jgi:hypothetical protein
MTYFSWKECDSSATATYLFFMYIYKIKVTIESQLQTKLITAHGLEQRTNLIIDYSFYDLIV